MTDLLLYFTLCLLAAIVVCAALFWITRPEKVEKPKELLTPPPFVRGILEKEFERAFGKLTIEVSDNWGETVPDELVFGNNEDTRPITKFTEGMPTSKHDDIVDSFDYDELWEAAARIPRESQEEKAKIDRWVNEAIESAGEDFEL